MARIIQTGDTPAKKRNAHMRSCAEVLRLLAQRNGFDDEAKGHARISSFLIFEGFTKRLMKAPMPGMNETIGKRRRGCVRKWRME